MLDLALVTRVLAQGAGKEVAEKRLSEISALSDAGDYAAAAKKAEKCLEDGVTDIRVLGAFWLGVFLESAPAGLGPMLSSAASALDKHFEVVRPEARKAKITDGALSLLLRTIVARVDFHEAARDATFKEWLSKSSPEVAAAAREAAAELRSAINKVIDKPRATEQLSELENRIESVFARAPAPAPRAAPAPEPSAPPGREAEPAREEPEEPAEEPEEPEEPDEDFLATGRASRGMDDADEDDAEPPPRPAPRSRAPRAEEPRAGDARTIEVSPALEEFLRKLDVFGRLLDQGEPEKAAIVAEDVRRAVESFDPRVYFPKLLAPYFRRLAEHVDELAPYWEAMDGPHWRALEQLYRVDIDAFAGDDEAP